jgi:hypothetical protein
MARMRIVAECRRDTRHATRLQSFEDDCFTQTMQSPVSTEHFT